MALPISKPQLPTEARVLLTHRGTPGLLAPTKLLESPVSWEVLQDILRAQLKLITQLPTLTPFSF